MSRWPVEEMLTKVFPAANASPNAKSSILLVFDHLPSDHDNDTTTHSHVVRADIPMPIMPAEADRHPNSQQCPTIIPQLARERGTKTSDQTRRIPKDQIASIPSPAIHSTRTADPGPAIHPGTDERHQAGRKGRFCQGHEVARSLPHRSHPNRLHR